MRRLHTYRTALLGLVFIYASILMSSCQEDLPNPGLPTEAREWVEASARYHDPESRWQAFSGAFEVKTSFPSGGGYSNSIFLNRVLDTFSRTIESGGFPLVQVVGPSGCSATWPNPDATEDQLRSNGLLEDPCDNILHRLDYYEFLFGIPMVALEDDISFRQNPDLVDAFGVECVEIELTFPGESILWYFYIHPTTYRLQAAKFVRSNGSGDWLSYEADTLYNGFLLKQTQRWYRLDGVTEIIVDEVNWGDQ